MLNTILMPRVLSGSLTHWQQITPFGESLLKISASEDILKMAFVAMDGWVDGWVSGWVD